MYVDNLLPHNNLDTNSDRLCYIQVPPLALAPIPESDGAPVLRKLPPPTLPKPVKKPSKAAPLPPPKPRKPEVLEPEDNFQVEDNILRNSSNVFTILFSGQNYGWIRSVT